MTTPLRDYTKIEEKNCQLVTYYGGKKFSWPDSITIGPKDEVIIVDRSNKEIIIFDKDLKLISTFGQGSGDVHVAVSHSVIEVSEWDDHVVKKYSLQGGDYQSEFGFKGREDGRFNYPAGLCFNSKGLLYVVDYGNYRVQVFSEDNAFLFKFDSVGHNLKQIMKPDNIAVDSSDQVYVNHWGGISVFSEDGNFIKNLTGRSNAICITPDDYIIINYHNDVLDVFSPTHVPIGELGECGQGKGQFNCITGIAVNSSGTIFVTELRNSRLQIISS